MQLRRELIARDRNEHLSDLARSVLNLAAKLASNGQYVEGLAAAKEAALLFAELTRTHGDKYRDLLDVARRLVEHIQNIS